MKIVGATHLSNHLTGCNVFEAVKIIMNNIKKGSLHVSVTSLWRLNGNINENVLTQKNNITNIYVEIKKKLLVKY